MMYKFNEKVSVKALADLRESVGWNRMEREYKNPLMTSYYHIAVYEDDKLIGYIDSVSNGLTDAYISISKFKRCDVKISPFFYNIIGISIKDFFTFTDFFLPFRKKNLKF